MAIIADVLISTDPKEACKDVDIAVMVGGFPRKGGMERKDVMAKNVAIYKSQAAALESGAKPDVKVCCLYSCKLSQLRTLGVICKNQFSGKKLMSDQSPQPESFKMPLRALEHKCAELSPFDAVYYV